MLGQRRSSLGCLGSSGRLAALQSSLLGIMHHHIRPTLVGRMIQQPTDVMYKQRIQQVGDLLLVGEIERTFEWDPFPDS